MIPSNLALGALGIWLLLEILFVFFWRKSTRGARAISPLQRRGWFALVIVVGLLALALRLPFNRPILPLIDSAEWVWLPGIFTASLLGMYVFGFVPGWLWTILLALLAAFLHKQRLSLPLEYGALYLGWFYSIYTLRRVYPGKTRSIWAGATLAAVVLHFSTLILSDLIWTVGVTFDWSWMMEAAATLFYPRGLLRIAEVFLASLVLFGLHFFWRRQFGRDFDQGLFADFPQKETSMVRQFLFAAIPLGLLSWFLFTLLGLHLASNRVRSLVEERLRGFADTADHQIGGFLEMGQLFITTWAQDDFWNTWIPGEEKKATEFLARVQNFAFFHEVLLVNMQTGQVLSSVEWTAGQAERPLQDAEKDALQLFRAGGVTFLEVVVRPRHQTTEIAFMAQIPPWPEWVLIGRSYLAGSEYLKPFNRGLENIAKTMNGYGFLLDQHGRPLILKEEDFDLAFFVQEEVLPQFYLAEGKEEAEPLRQSGFRIIRLPNGQQFLAFLEPLPTYSWALLLLVPLEAIHRETAQLGQGFAIWSSGQIALLMLLAVWVLRMATSSLRELSREAQRIAEGDLDHPLAPGGLAEDAQLRQAFEQMRQSLKRRLEELQRLLDVGRRLVASLDWSQVITPVLDAAMYVPEAKVARVALVPEFFPPGIPSETQRFFGRGKVHGRFIVLDEILLQSMLDEDYRLEKLLHLWPSHLNLAPPKDLGEEARILLLPMWHEGQPIGTFYVVFEKLPDRWESLLRYYRTLAEQLRLALSSVRLYTQAETERQRLEAVLWSTPDAIFMTDNNLRVVLANLSARRLFQWPQKDEAYPLPFETAFSMEELQDVLLSTQEAAQSREIAFPDGRVFFVTVAPVRVRGRQVGLVGILRDITHLKRAEAAKAEFVAAISHDLRSPLTLIRGYTSMLEMGGELTERQRRYIQQILMAVDNIAGMVDNLLELSRLDMGMQLHLEWVPLRETVLQVVKSYEVYARQKRIKLTPDIHPETPAFIEVDSSLFQRAIQNLVDNALKYTPEGGRVSVQVRPRGKDRVLIVVEDTGIGIAPTERERLFDRFFQAERARKMRAGGKGLGLAIVKSMVERHHGTIWVESEVGQGSRFYIELPIRQPREEEKAEGKKPAKAKPTGNAGKGKRKAAKDKATPSQ